MSSYRSTRAGILLAACVAAAGTVAHAATNTANLRLFCQSVRIEKGSASALSLAYYTEFSSLTNWNQPNAEFYTFSLKEPPTHFSYFLLTGDVFQGFGPFEGGMWITVPMELDADAHGIADFFRVAEGIDTVTGNGAFEVYDPINEIAPLVDYGTVQASWRRTPGQHRGQCDLVLSSQAPTSTPIIPAGGLRFTHHFEILEFAGTYRYQPSETRIEGMMNVTQVGRPERTLHGPMSVIRAFDPLKDLYIEESAWTNHLGQSLQALRSYLDRSPEFELQYRVPFFFDDGDLSTDDPDYDFYYIVIEDPNDHDGDGIPDLTDPPAERGPTLGITLSGGAPVLTIEGKVGQILRIQTAPSLETIDWTDAQTVTLTNATQSVPLPNPNTNTAYWRTLAAP